MKICQDVIYLYLIARRSQYRAGTRLNARGIDDQGNVTKIIIDLGSKFRRNRFFFNKSIYKYSWRIHAGLNYNY